jgi:hypothetical protein
MGSVSSLRKGPCQPVGEIATLKADEAAALLPFGAGRAIRRAGPEAALFAFTVLVGRAKLSRVLAVPAGSEGEAGKDQEQDKDQPFHDRGLLERRIEILVYPNVKDAPWEARTPG